MKKHYYKSNLEWTGNSGSGTSDYKSYERSYVIKIDEKPTLEGSSDPAFRGDETKYNPEELFLASISSCHMLWYLHLCSVNKVVVIDYEDEAHGVMIEKKDGSGQFQNVTLYLKVVIENESNIDLAKSLHQQANEKCFIANSCNFEIGHEVTVVTKGSHSPEN
jgi:organic hydroperoxide reductase OsmC/OhrA